MGEPIAQNSLTRPNENRDMTQLGAKRHLLFQFEG